MLPLLLPLMLGGLAVSGGANLYGQYQQRKIYRREAKAASALYRGYNSYLEKQGREMNPNRAWFSYLGTHEKAQKGIDVSYAQSLGTLGGTIGAGAGLSSGALGHVQNTISPSKSAHLFGGVKSPYKWL